MCTQLVADYEAWCVRVNVMQLSCETFLDEARRTTP